MSLAVALLEEIERCVAANGGGRIETVHAECGPLAGVEPLLLREAFEQISHTTCAEGSKLIIDEVPLRAHCDDCGRDFEPVRFTFRCPACSSGRCRLLQGDALILRRVTLIQE
jgi:hydrogenase nickel incorporation protein HypA/HybF